MVETYQQNMRELDNDLRGNSTAGNEEQKYEILYQKEKEINEFTEKFEVEKKQLENEISDDQLHIASLLEHMQKTMARQNKLPTQQMVEEMKNDLKFKQGQLEDSETTAARLRVQKEQIKADLDKVKSLEERIVNELKSAEQKITSMEDDMKNKFTKTDDLKRQFDEQKYRLSTIKNFLQSYRNGLTKQVTFHSMKHDTKKNQILQSEIYNRLNDIEKKLI
jgi:intraflagellar transport protein 74